MIVLICAGLFAIALLTRTIYGVSRYDIASVRERASIAKHPNSRANRKRPLVSVVVYSCNNLPGLQRSIDSLLAITYRKIEIVIIDAASSDGSAKLARAYARDNARVVVSAQKKPRGLADGIATAQKKYISGEYVLVLAAGDAIQSATILSLVQRANAHPAMQSFALATRVAPAMYVHNLAQRYWSILLQREAKIRQTTVIDAPQARVWCSAASLFEPRLSSRFLSDCVVTVSSLARQQFTYNYSVLSAMVTAGILAYGAAGVYALHIALTVRQPVILGLYLAVTVVYVLHAVWNNENLSFADKLKSTAALPSIVLPAVAYGLRMAVRYVSGLRMRSWRTWRLFGSPQSA